MEQIISNEQRRYLGLETIGSYAEQLCMLKPDRSQVREL